jgi:hypothetical protein
MRTTIVLILIVIPFCSAIGQQVYLKKNSNGHLKKIRPRTVLTFRTSDSTYVIGRIVSVADSTISVSTYERHAKSAIIEIPLSSVSHIRNDLMNSSGLSETAGWMLAGSIVGVLIIPIAWIEEGAGEALEGVKFIGTIVGASLVLLTPYFFKRRFDTRTKWSLIIH